MLSHRAKRLFYSFAGPFMKLNAWRYRSFVNHKNEVLKAHLGPGQFYYLDGWVNVDANMFTAKCDIWADLRNPLPFKDATVDAFYSHHMVEHLPNIELHLQEVFRCLKPGGVYRVGGPNGDSAIKKFVENDLAWFYDFPDSRTSIGGRFENLMYCRGEHVTILTQSFLNELMLKIGFINLKTMLPVKETGYPDLFTDCFVSENESDFETPHTLIIECEKALE